MAPSFFDSIYALGTIPVLEIDNVDRAVPLTYSLLSGGLPVAEITLRTDAALDSIREITRRVSSVLVGAGTVISRDQAQAACEAGAKFLVSPGLADEVVLWAQEWYGPVVVGAVTPTEIIHALDLGLTLLKFFPAEAMGGLKTLTAISDPFPQVRFIPTGGIRQENLAEYLQAEKIHVVGGSWMAKRQAINEGRFDDITRMAKAARDVIKKIRG
jgi:2-dehydro-3-deoxyphosphogluconate aldolase / (4S)-4-hydroxy-2-oxoglutarate aldolase